MRVRIVPDRASWPAFDLSEYLKVVRQGRAAYRLGAAGMEYEYFNRGIQADWFRHGWEAEKDLADEERWAKEREDWLIETGRDFVL